MKDEKSMKKIWRSCGKEEKVFRYIV